MELVYIYIQNFDNIFSEQQMNFSNNYHINIDYKTKELIIMNKKSNINNFYSNNIKNITMLLGENGSGKTSVLDILGMTSEDRKANYERNKKNSYLILYSIGNDEFLLEYVGSNILKQISNIDPKYYEYIDSNVENFGIERIKKSEEKIILDLEPNSKKIAENINISYILNNNSERIKIKYAKNKIESNNNSLMRMYKLYSGKLDEYNYIKKINYETIKSSRIRLKIGCEISEIDEMEAGVGLKYTFKERDLFELFKCNLYNNYNPKFKLYTPKKYNNKIGKETLNRYDYNNKQSFVMDFLCKYIVSEFYNNLYTKINNINNGEEKHNINKIRDEELFEMLEICSSTNFNYSLIQSIIVSDIVEELELINKAIEFFKNKDSSKIDQLIYLLRYLNSRILTLGNFYMNDYFEYIEQIIKIIQNLDLSYFDENEISIDINIDDSVIVDMLECFDGYSQVTNSNTVVNIENILNVRFENLSQGEKYYFKLYSRLYDIIKNANKSELIVLLIDEPDQSLHPEWSRCFINNIINETNQYSINLQIIVSTHSPFMVSDIIKENVYLLNKDLNTELYYIKNIEDSSYIHNTFASNIYEILKMSFFLRKTMGEFSYKKVTDWIKKIENKDTSDKNLKENLDLIGEKIIRKKVQDLYKEKYCIDENKYKLIKLIELEKDNNKIQQLVDLLEE